MQFIIDPSMRQITPHLSVAWIRIQLSRDAKANLDVIESLKASALSSLIQRIPSGQSVDLEKETSIAQWMQTYRNMKINPKKIKPTHFAFASRLLKDKKWPRSIGPLVDVYLVNQAKHLLPHGGFDVESLSGDTIKLLVSDKTHQFQPLGVSLDDRDKMETTKLGEVLYQDISQESITVLTRYFNHRDTERTKIVDVNEDEEKSTKDFVLIIESVDGSEEGKAKLLETANDLAGMYSKVYGDGLVTSFVRVVELSSEDDKDGATLSLDM
jgi:DNA/RNA-binding domain of Phe-tRNA-synthetase-like protein